MIDDTSIARDALVTYTRQFATTHLGNHGVGSAFGAWLLLALVAQDPNLSAHDRSAIVDVLGCDTDIAATFTTQLVGDPHPGVAAAVAAWANLNILNTGYTTWKAVLPASVETGPIPTQTEADRWAAEHTFNLIDNFPIRIEPDTAAVIASAVAANLSWDEPFNETESGRLGGEFGAGATIALHAPAGHRVEILEGPHGMVVAHCAHSTNGLTVTSALPAGPMTDNQLWETALAAAEHMAGKATALRRVPLDELELGTGPAWTITETVEHGYHLTPERYDTVLPAWSAQSDHTLGGTPGFDTAAHIMSNWLNPEHQGAPFEAKQTAVARYHAKGFEAAAVTAMAMRAAAMHRADDMTVRTAHIQFNRPYAVVATTSRYALDIDGNYATQIGAQWDTVPVFTAHVTQPD